MKKILLAGGAGYIGTELCKRLQRLDYKVTVIDNLMYKQHSLLNCCSYDNFNFINGDVCDSYLMKNYLSKNIFMFQHRVIYLLLHFLLFSFWLHLEFTIIHYCF